jgi:AcrR family transcriptional regulator
MNTTPRLGKEERKTQIVEAVLPLFSEKDINSVTSKEMAQAAGVSEALIYKHFPNKRELYESVFASICSDLAHELDALDNLEGNFESFMQFMRRFVDHVFGHDENFNRFLPKVIMRSIIEDGEFAKYFLQKIDAKVATFFSRCLKSCKKEKLISIDLPPEDLAFWFSHHCVVMMKFMIQPGKQIVDYKKPTTELKKHLFFFLMRGIGFREEFALQGWKMITDQTDERRVG